MSKARFIETANYIYPSTSCLPNIVFEQAVVATSPGKADAAGSSRLITCVQDGRSNEFYSASRAAPAYGHGAAVKP
jgi:hypothetical protein